MYKSFVAYFSYSSRDVTAYMEKFKVLIKCYFMTMYHWTTSLFPKDGGSKRDLKNVQTESFNT